MVIYKGTDYETIKRIGPLTTTLTTLHSPTAKSSVMRDTAGVAIDWYAEQAFTISCICRKLATASTSSRFCGLKLSLAVYMNSRT